MKRPASRRDIRPTALAAHALDVLAGMEPMQFLRDLRSGYVRGALHPLPPLNLVPDAEFVETHPAEVLRLDPPPRPLDPTYPYDVRTDGHVRREPHGFWRLPGASWYPDSGLVVAGPRSEMVEGCFRFPLQHTRANDARHRRAPVHRVAGVGLPLETEFIANHYHNLLEHGPRMALLRHPYFERFDDIQLFTYTMGRDPVLRVLADRLLPGNVRVVEVSAHVLIRPDELLMPVPAMAAYAAVPPAWYLASLRRHVARLDDHPDRLVYISRAGAAKRAIRNEDDVIRRLEGRGFEFLRTEQLRPEEVISLMGRTRLLVGQFGAGLSNVLFCPPGAGVVEMSSDAFWTAEFFWMAQAAGISFTSVVGRAQETRPRRWSGHRDEQYRHHFYRRRDGDLAIDVDAVDEAVTRELARPR